MRNLGPEDILWDKVHEYLLYHSANVYDTHVYEHFEKYWHRFIDTITFIRARYVCIHIYQIETIYVATLKYSR